MKKVQSSLSKEKHIGGILFFLKIKRDMPLVDGQGRGENYMGVWKERNLLELRRAWPNLHGMAFSPRGRDKLPLSLREKGNSADTAKRGGEEIGE